MVEISRGLVGDRPWPELFATLAFAGEACELVVEVGAQVHRVAFADQAVIAASSPLASDSALRVMRTCGVITPAMMPTVASRVAATPSVDPIEVLAAMAQLPPETALLMRRRTIAVAATRVFTLLNGSYRVTRELTLRIKPGTAIDVRALIYEGVRTHLTDEQLAGAVARSGTSFVLRPEVGADLPRFGFSPVEMPVVDELCGGTSLSDLAFRYPEVGARGVHAIALALLAAHAIGPVPRQSASSPRASAQYPAQTFARSSEQVPAQRISDQVPVQRTTGQFSTQVPVTGRFAARTGNTDVFETPPAPSLELAQVPRRASRTGSLRAASPPKMYELAEEPRGSYSGTTDTFDLSEESPVGSASTIGVFELAKSVSTDTFELAEQPRSRRSATFAAAEPPRELAEQPASRTASTFVVPAPPFELAEQPRSRKSGTFAAAEPPRELAAPPRSFTTKPPTTGVFAVPIGADRPTTGPQPTHDVLPRPSTTGSPPLQSGTGPHVALELPSAPAQRTTGVHAAIDRATHPVHPTLARVSPRPTNPDSALDARPTERTPASHLAPEHPVPSRTLGPPPQATVPVACDPEMRVSRDFSVTIRPSRLTGQDAAVKPPADDGQPDVIASQHYDRGMALLDHDVDKAIGELQVAARTSGDVDHEAMLAWAQFCAAPIKETIAKATKAALAKSIYQSKHPSLAHFYLGRMERMLGRDREALSHFKTVIDLIPRHADALAEIRTLEARLFPKQK